MNSIDELNKLNKDDTYKQMNEANTQVETCPICHNHCSLSNPGCGRGVAYSKNKTAEQDQYGDKNRHDGEHNGEEHHDREHHGREFHNEEHRMGAHHGGDGRNEERRIGANHGRAHHGGRCGNHERGCKGEGQERWKKDLNGAEGDMRLLMQMQRCAHLMQHRKGYQHGTQGRNRLIAILGDKGSMSQRELQEYLDIRSSSMSEVLTKMEAEGLITRSRDENDKRNVTVELSDLGRQSFTGNHENRQQAAKEMFQNLSEEEKKELDQILDKLLKAWEPSVS